ncbi:hypothetical protein B9Z55_016452 [Caenorhabditis nigoni]|uniref:F-box domain-containing protein n=1 Tax=Caenorhabditis nigoni TaxID=1611254 RepID=A0A2G5T5K7_9PELO|nr:hypothetical protein B9Z55_016452 [Caenorhabditis nigoni]
MPINLHKLPSLVGVMVVTELEYQEIFLLSLCSRRTTFLVEKAGIKAPKLTFQLEECHGYYQFKIGIMNNYILLPIMTLMHFSKKLKSKRRFTVKFGLEYEADTSLQLRCEMFSMQDGSFQHRIYCAHEPVVVQQVFQDQINSIFHYFDTYQLIMSVKCKGPLPNVTNVSKIQIEDETVDPQFLTNVLTTYSDHHSLSVLSRIVGELPNDSPFFQVQNIYVHTQCGPDYFHNFVGRNMNLYNVTVTEQDVIQFLHKWISNEAYHNLDTLSLCTRKPMNGDQIRQAIELEEYDPNKPEKRPAHYAFERGYIGSTPKVYNLGHDFVEIKRTTDGKRAFLYAHGYHFKLFVHKNCFYENDVPNGFLTFPM